MANRMMWLETCHRFGAARCAEQLCQRFAGTQGTLITDPMFSALQQLGCLVCG